MSLHDSEDDDSFDEDARPAPIFRRGVSGSFVRLSTAIRRSLRLPPRRVSRQMEEFPLKKGDPDGPLFSEYGHFRVQSSSVPSRIDEIKENKRLNRDEKVKKLIRKGNWPITHEVRKQLWLLLCHDKNFDSIKNLFENKTAEEGALNSKPVRPLFLNEEGTVICNYDLTESGALRLLRLLSVVENDHPTMNSSPMLYALSALLLHYMSDSATFACAEYLLKKPGFLTKTAREWYASNHTVLALVKKHKPNAYALLKRRCNTADDEILVETVKDYLQWIFQELPVAYAVRIVDCFLVEGQKFIYRAAIAIVYIWAKTTKNRPSDGWDGKSGEERISSVKAELLQTAKNCEISTDTFIETCVRIRNFKHSTITRFHQEFEKKVQPDVDRRASQKRHTKADIPLYTEVFQSVIVEADAAAYIMKSLPPRLQLNTPRLLFRLSQDGASFTHMWSKIDEADQSILIIRSTKGDVFGAYCSSCWAERNDRKERTKSKYFGTGESFVWMLDLGDPAGWPIVYPWVGSNLDQTDSCPQMFMAAGDRLIVIGSGDGDAIRISEELTRGMSGQCRTFDSPPLVVGRAFEIHELEVYEVF